MTPEIESDDLRILFDTRYSIVQPVAETIITTASYVVVITGPSSNSMDFSLKIVTGLPTPTGLPTTVAIPLGHVRDDLGNGYYRFTFTLTTPATNGYFLLQLCNAAGAFTRGVLLKRQV